MFQIQISLRHLPEIRWQFFRNRRNSRIKTAGMRKRVIPVPRELYGESYQRKKWRNWHRICSMLWEAVRYLPQTAYGYTTGIKKYKTINGKRINMNVAVSYDEKKDVTNVIFGSPIVNSDYWAIYAARLWEWKTTAGLFISKLIGDIKLHLLIYGYRKARLNFSHFQPSLGKLFYIFVRSLLCLLSKTKHSHIQVWHLVQGDHFFVPTIWSRRRIAAALLLLFPD